MKLWIPIVIVLNPDFFEKGEDKYIGWVVHKIPNKTKEVAIEIFIHDSANDIEMLIRNLKESIYEAFSIFPESLPFLQEAKFPDLWEITKHAYDIALDFFEDEQIAEKIYKQMIFTMVEVDFGN